jgi:AAA domain
MQDLMRKMAAYYGLLRKWDVQEEKAERGVQAKHISHISFPREIPLKLLNNYGFDMLQEEHREMLEEEIRDIDPALVVLDPLYLMVGGADLNRSDQMAPFFKWLIHLKFTYGTAIMVNHHFRKQQQNGPQVRSGQRVLGSTTFHAWVASALYSEKTSTEEDGKNVGKLKLEREFRNVGPLRTLDIKLNIGDAGSLDFSADILRYDAVRELIRLVEAMPGITAIQAAETLGIDKRTVLKRARGSERILLEGGKRGRGQTWKLNIAEATDAED